MANPKHLAILKQGAEAWNEWRKRHPGITPDLSDADLIGKKLKGVNLAGANLTRTNLSGAHLRGADLSNAHLGGADLSGVNLSGADLHGAHLRGAHLRGADLSGANLSGADLLLADLSGADLISTDLTDANLNGASLSGANLTGANLSGACMWRTIIANTDLGGVKGLSAVVHDGPSSIGIDTLYQSQGKIPDEFLRGAGVPDDLIAHAHSLINKPTDFYSCFISYSEQDREFAGRLHRDLEIKRVRCWLFPEDAKWGETVWDEIDGGIKHYDKLVVVCSENSLQSPAVLREIERGLQREDRERKNVLFPIRIDDYIFAKRENEERDKWEHERKADVVKKVVGDFCRWKDHDAYQKSLARLLKHLQAADSKKA